MTIEERRMEEGRCCRRGCIPLKHEVLGNFVWLVGKLRRILLPNLLDSSLCNQHKSKTDVIGINEPAQAK
jgi:hypothetical protein